MNTEERIKLFENELSTFEDKDYRDFAEYCLARVPDYFFTIPASSTGKYHPNYCLGEGGLVRHTKAAMQIGEYLFECGTFAGSSFVYNTKDVIRLCLMFHDCCKQGTTNSGSGHTEFEHPLMAQEFMINCYKDYQDTCNDIGLYENDLDFNSIASHMGKWNTSKYSNITLPIPIFADERFVHTCDYLASRKTIEINLKKFL